MANRSRIAFFAALIAVVVALAGLTYVWLSAQRPGEGPSGNPSVTLEQVRLVPESPIALAFAPDSRVFYAERNSGNIQILGTATTDTTTFYTLTGTDSPGERGLLGLALDPDFDTMPYVYAYQTYRDGGSGTVYNRIVRILANQDRDMGVSHTVLLRLPNLSGATNHNGGVIAFGPDGMLYALVGENANEDLSQDASSPMGKVLRMNRNGWAPPDNPFVGDPAWFNLTYSYGHRNMFGLAFHPTTEDLLITENGPTCNDEVNLLSAGGNFGWGPTQTCGTPPPAPSNTNQDGPAPILPIWWWDDTICPTNAAVYGGPLFPAWQGDLFMGDCNFGNLHRLDLVGPEYDSVQSDTILRTAPGPILDVEMGLDGHLWVTTPSAIYRLVPVQAQGQAPPALVISTAGWATAVPGCILVFHREFGGSVSRIPRRPGSLSRGRDVAAAGCRRTGFRPTIGSSNPFGGS
jgi:aldose sugar dehydrogenase